MKPTKCAGCKYLYSFTDSIFLSGETLLCCEKAGRSHTNPQRHKSIEILRQCPIKHD